MKSRKNSVSDSSIDGIPDELFHLLFSDYSYPAYIISSVDQKLLDANKTALNRQNLAKTKFLQLSLKDIFSPQKYTEIIQTLDNLNKNINGNGKQKPPEYLQFFNIPDSESNSVLFIDRDESIKEDPVDSQFTWPSIIEHAEDAVYAITLEGTIIKWNSGAEKLYGYSPEEICQKHISILIPPENKYEVDEIIQNLKNGARIETFETIRLKKEGEEITVSVTVSPIKDVNNKLIGASIISRDITEKKHIDILLKEKENRFKQIAENIKEVFYIRSISGNNIYYISPAYKEIWGREPDNLYANPGSLLESVHIDHRDCVRESLEKQKMGENINIEYLISRPDGSSRWIRDRAFPVKNEYGELYRIIGLAEDITTQKEIELEKIKLLKDIEAQKLRIDNLISTVPGVVWEAWGEPDAANQKINFVSDHVEKMLGYKVEEWLSIPNFWLSIVHPDDKERAAKNSLEFFTSKKGGTDQFRWIAKNGTILWIEATSVIISDSDGNPVGMRGVSMDITGRKKVEEELNQSEKQLRQLLALIPAGVYTCNEEGLITFYNSKAEELWGRIPKLNDYQEKFCACYKVFLPDGTFIRPNETPMAMAIKEEKSFRNVEAIVERPDGFRFIANVNIDLIRDQQGKVIGAVNVFQDITENKNADDVKTKLGSIVESSFDAIISKDLNGIITSWNKAAENLFGYKLEEVIGKPITILIPPDRIGEEKDIIANIHQGKKIEHFQTVRMRKDGTNINISLTISPLKNSEGKIIGASKIARNITNQKLAEDITLKLAAIVESSFDAIVSKDLNGIINSWNSGAEKLYGYEANEIIGRSMTVLIPPDMIEEEINILRHVQNGVRIEPFETKRLHKNGSYVNVSLTVSPLKNTDGKIIGASHIARNITEETKSKQALKESESRFSIMADNIAQFAWIADAKGWIYWYNQRWFDYTGTNLEQMEGWGWQKVHHPDHIDRVTKKFKEYIQSGEGWEDTFPIRGKDGNYRWFLSRALPIRDEQNQILQWFGTNTDITELKLVQEKLLKQKQTLEALNNASISMVSEFDLEKIVQNVTDAGREATGAEFGAFFHNVKNRNGESYTLYTISGASRDDFSKFPMPRNTALFAPTFNGEGVVRIDDVLEDSRYGKNAPYYGMPKGHLPVRSYLAVPVVSRSGEVIGGLFYGHGEPGKFTKDSEEVLINLAANASIAIDNANLYAALQLELENQKRVEEERKLLLANEQAARRKSEEMQIHLTFLSEASKVLSSSLDFHQTLSAVASLAVPDIADWCTIDILNENQTLERVAVVHSDPAKVKLAHDLAKMYPPDPESKTGVLNVIRTGQSEIYTELTPDIIKSLTNDVTLVDLLRNLGLNSAMIVPLFSRDKVLGAITFIYAESGKRYSENDLILAEELARRGGIAIENSHLYYRAQLLNSELDKRVKIRTAQLESANQELEAFSYSVSHDLRAPLRHIAGFISLLQNRISDTLDTESNQLLKKVSSSAKKMGNLIDDMLAFSRIGRIEIQRVKVNMQEVVNDVIQNLEDYVEGRDITWSVGKLPFVFGDRSMLRLVMVNLISNAIKFTRPKNNVVIEISSIISDDEYVFSVKDNGVGFDMKYVNKLFAVFQRLHRAEEFEGEGIGLANVQRIIDRHGGRTWAKGELNEGATFYFSFPRLKNYETN